MAILGVNWWLTLAGERPAEPPAARPPQEAFVAAQIAAQQHPQLPQDYAQYYALNMNPRHWDMPMPTPEEIMHARQRSFELLLQHCTEEQRRTLHDPASPYIIIETRDRRFRIDLVNASTHVLFRRAPDHIYYICIHCWPHSSLPLADQVLAKKLFIETNEAGFMATGNLLHQFTTASAPHLFPPVPQDRNPP